VGDGEAAHQAPATQSQRCAVIAQKIGPYVLQELLGEGGIGQVYEGHDTFLGRQVAVKILRPEMNRDRNFIQRFYNEAQSLGDLTHKNIPQIYAIQLEEPQPAIVMELVRGNTLEALLGQLSWLPLRESLAVVAQAVCAGWRTLIKRG